MRDGPLERRLGQEPDGERPADEGCLLEAVEGRVEPFLHCEVEGDPAGLGDPVLSPGEPVRLQPLVPEARHHGVTRQLGQLTERGDPEPSKGRGQLFLPHRRHVERTQEGGVVGDPVYRIGGGGQLSSPLSGEGAGGEPDAIPRAGEDVDLLDHPLDQGGLVPVEANGAGYRDEHQPGHHHLDPRHEVLHHQYHGFEGRSLGGGVGHQGDHRGADRLGFPTAHPDHDPGRCGGLVDRNDPRGLGIYRLGGFIR
jgi:hypothetical protein